MRVFCKLIKPKDWKIILLEVVAGTIVAVITIFLLLPLWSRISAPNKTTPALKLIGSLLDFSKNIEQELGPLEETIVSIEKRCKEARYDIKSWIILGQLYVASNRYDKALKCYTRAYEIDPRIADPYYARGNLYYDLALIDLIRKKRFTFDPDKLICELEPDKQSRILFTKVVDEYNQAEEYPTLQDLNPSSELMITSLFIVGHRKRQIDEFFKSSSTITLHRVELMRLVVWIPSIFPKNKELVDKVMKLGKNLFDYAKKHREEFPYLLIPED